MSEEPGSRAREHIDDMDALFWGVEKDPHLRNTITAVLVLERAPDRAVAMARLERASRVVPGWRHRLVSPPLSLANPRWIADPQFDLTYHVRWLGAPREGTLESVLEYARASMTSGFDKERPLWTFTVVDGLKDGRAAVIIKLHHVLVDGVGGIGLLPMIVDFGPEPGDLGEMPPVPEHHPMGRRALIFDALATQQERLRGVATETRVLLRSAPRLLQDRSALPGTVRRNLSAVRRLLTPAAHLRSPIMTSRRFWLRWIPMKVDFHALHRAARAHGVSVNSAFMVGVGLGFALYHQRMGHPVEELRTMMAVNIRKEDDPLGGNRVLGGFFSMPVGTDDPAQRLKDVQSRVLQLRDDTSQPLAASASTLVMALGPLMPSFVGSMTKRCDLLMSNIAGVNVPLWFAGASIEALYGFGPTMGTAANATLVTYCGGAYIGLNVDASAVEDQELLARCVREGFDTVLALAADESSASAV